MCSRSRKPWLRNCEGKGITVSALCPGFTDTNLVDNAKRENAAFRALPSSLMADPKSTGLRK